MFHSPRKYDVFISFRGEDTRTTFTSHLRDSLYKQNIQTYIDYELKKGDEIWPTLAKAIQDSHISIVIFSENFASSKWCLDELLKILECRENQGQVVIPVFYKIDPSDVRYQIGTYKKAFAKHERAVRNNESFLKVSAWKEALTKAANISGWDSSTHKNDSEVIQNIVQDVWQKLSLKYPKELKGLVEIDENSNYIESLLKEFPRIGIWGMGGIGKTTIARSLFAKHFPEYESVCFLEKVREESEKLGITSVRKKLLGELLKQQITTSDTLGTTFIERRLSSKRVLIVLDDVDNATQLEYLCGGLDDLGPDSRLIITTRDKHTLRGSVNRIYEVTKWTHPESLKLFSLGAFQQSLPKEGYEHLSERAVAYAGGIPLALKVLGLHFRSRSIEFWESELSHLENKDESWDEIREVLQVSYKGLQKREQAIFLDIAFFFKDQNKDSVIRILDACGFSGTSGIQILQDKALITISNSNRIEMHDLLQKMGLDIVREEFSNDPGRRSRLREIKDVPDVLKNSKGTDAVEGITLDLSQRVDFHLPADTFNRMTKLRILRLYVPSDKKRLANVCIPRVFEQFSNELRYLEWNGYPLKFLPQNFCPKSLVEIHMPYSHVKELWQGMQDLVNLEAMDLSECQQLQKLPDLSRASKLKWVDLSGCESLLDVHPSILSLDTLETLMLDRCKKLNTLKSEKHLKSLVNINVNGCISLKEFSVSSGSMERLDLSTTGTKKLHSSIGRLSKLKWLNLEYLRLENLPEELSFLISLEELRISNCKLVNKKKLHVLCDGLRSLKVLHLKDCYKLFELPDNISFLSSLLELRLDRSGIEMLPESIKHLQELEILSLLNCTKLQLLPELPPYIKQLHVVNCKSLVIVSTLKTFSVMMIGKEKFISFKNGKKLNEHSLFRIIEGLMFTMKSAAFHNVLVRMLSVDTRSYNYNSVEVCFPGCSVPRQFTYQTTGSSITIELPDPKLRSNLLGFIYSVVLPSSHEMKQHGVIIQCQCREKDGKKGNATTWHHKAIKGLNSDHVFVWYDPFHCDSILRHRKQSIICFEFFVTIESEELLVGDLVSIKRCGVHLIWSSMLEVHSFLRELNLELNLKLDLGVKLALALEMEQGRGNWEDNKRLLHALENGDEVDESLKMELESRRRGILMLIETKSIGSKL
ncbi:disease resistance-like protein DSC1 [Abrus precatorius]|uniref:ADP-ribosyl cyclase/cyclic ADP-ribose hydrolase n=1 Tax=Abrus precatorius TaxID=3816 RepID=A0A8B8K101_ABRPR|nr:disease resistance-like protein DSC1 [Abrus precatorius]